MPREYYFLTLSDCEALLQEMARVLHPEREHAVQTFRLLGRRHGLGMLQSALAQPRQGFGGRYLHRTLFDKAGALFRSLVKDHPLEDGNERLGLAATGVFLLLNGWVLLVPAREAVEYARMLASATSTRTASQVGYWLRRRSVRLDDVLNESTRSAIPLSGELPLGMLMPALESLRESLLRRGPGSFERGRRRE